LSLSEGVVSSLNRAPVAPAHYVTASSHATVKSGRERAISMAVQYRVNSNKARTGFFKIFEVTWEMSTAQARWTK
jgi:hypothetical protein